MSLLDALKAKALAAWQYAGQVPAGAVQGTIADSHIASDVADRKRLEAKLPIPNAPDLMSLIVGKDYRPAIADQIPALYGVIKSLTGNAPDPTSYSGKAIQRVNAATDRTNKVLHIKDPENAVQTALNIAGSLIVPGPKIPKATAITKGGRLLQNTARVAAETAIPMRNISIKTALATQIPLGVGLKEGVDGIANDPNYHGVADQLHDPFAALEQPQEVDPFAAIEAPQTTDDPFSALEAPEPVEDHELTTLEKGLLGASAVAGAGVALGAGRWALSRIKSGSIPTGGLAGSRVVSPRGTKTQALDAAIFQHDAPARNAANEFLTPDEAAQFNYNSDRIIPQALGAKIKNAIVTGEMPGTTVSIKPLAPLLQAISKDLTPVEHQMVSDSLLAKSALDDVNQTGVQSTFNDKTPHELQQMVDLVDNDPRLRKYADGVREQYRGLLEYQRAAGLIDTATYQDLVTKRPNYVHMSRDVTREGGPNSLFIGSSGSNLIDEQFARQREAFGGVQTGATRNPIDELQGRYSDIIRHAQLNDHKREFFTQLNNSHAVGATVPTNDGSRVALIKRIDERPKSMEGIHTVWDNGRPVYYKIGDPALDRALQFSPRATMPLFGQMRQVAQFFTTGSGNLTSLFGATVSPVYDTLSGMVLRPQGTDIGLINEALNRMGSPANIGRLDLTALVSAPIGALRSMFDEFTGSMATSLSDQLLRDHGWLLDSLGQQKTTALRDMLKSRYDSSIRSMLDAEGVSSHQQWGSDSGLSVPTGIDHIAPNFASDMSRRVTAEAMKGNPSLYEGVLSQGKNAFAQVKSNTISRMYSGLLRNMQEGFRYQFAATNLPKVRSMRDLNELMSTTRRISSDTGQFGGNDNWNRLADSVMYANVGTQALGEWAKRFAADPRYFISNLATTMGTIAALRYGSMMTDPEAAEKTKMKTDAQNAASVSMFGGVELPIEPMLRPVLGPLFAVMDNLAMDQEGNFNPSFANAIYNYYDDDQAETRGQSAYDAFMAGVQGAVPLSPSGVPAANALLAMNGVDPNMARITGEPMQIRSQQQSLLQGDGKTTDSMLSAANGKIIDSLIGSGITNMIDMADQWQRAAFSQNRDGSRGTSPAGAAKVALSQLVDSAARTNGPAQGLLFKDYEKVHSIADTDFKLYQGKRDGMDKATKIFRDDIKNAFVTGSDPRTALWRPADLVPPDLTQTPLAPIGAITLEVQKSLRKMEAHTAALTKQIDAVKNQKTTRIEDRNKQINEINKERRYMYGRMLQVTRMAEDQIGQTIGDDGFTFQNFDPERYASPAQAPQVQPSPQPQMQP